MKAYGLRNKIFYNFEDHHPSKGFVNWWEDESFNVCKKRERRKGKKIIKEALNENSD